jgi:hypothetical protein
VAYRFSEDYYNVFPAYNASVPTYRLTDTRWLTLNTLRSLSDVHDTQTVTLDSIEPIRTEIIFTFLKFQSRFQLAFPVHN